MSTQNIPSKSAKLTITKKLLGTDGKAKNGDGKFYAGIFMDKDHTELADSNTVSANIVELDLNDVSEARLRQEIIHRYLIRKK